MRKRGAIEIQFNWILVLVVGAAIIIIFMSFISKQQGISDASANILAANTLNAILHGYGNTDISDSLEVPESKINFNCNSFYINGIQKQSAALNLFSPAYLETNKLHLLSFMWNMPYRITNFAYVTSPEIRYIFIGNSEFARKMFEKVRGKIRADGFTNAQAIQDENDDIIRIIFFGQEPEMPENLKAAKNPITSLRVDGDEGNGAIEFFELVDGNFEPRGESYYIGEASLFGAIFSDDINRYNCVMEKAFNKLNIISQIYQERVNNITQEYIIEGKNRLCEGFYSNNLLLILNSLSILSSFDFKLSGYAGLIEASNEIEKMNKRAEALSCTLIY